MDFRAPQTQVGTEADKRKLWAKLGRNNMSGVDSLPRKQTGKSGIHINPANRGKFKATMARTGKSASELKQSADPLTRKRATFALNAKKWSHK
jgi:hypothetical protein